MQMKLKLKKQQLTANNNRLKVDLFKLQDPNILNNIRAELGGKFAPLLTIGQDVQEATDSLISALTNAAKSNLGRAKSTRKHWVTQEALTACDRRRQLKAIRTRSETDNNRYQESNKTVRRTMRKANQEWIQNECCKIDICLTQNDTKHFQYGGKPHK